ncbi:hypothetical protein CFOL_v3_29205 [Cephalotus follicularis]|uniref:Uncharacterized protein n=1 Tax=Cephalotus follicularis TaxID=3775 RepID=A0A1Q3D053_CEPFO|nr:hypothetical protein CFOL_v3_29205 [Cephalotus follicularis]
MGQDDAESDEDDLYDKWLGSGNETEVPMNGPSKSTLDSVIPSETPRVQWEEKLSVAGLSGIKTPDRSSPEPGAASADVGVRSDEGQQSEEPMVQFQEKLSLKGARSPNFHTDSKGYEMECTTVASGSIALDYTDREMAIGENILGEKSDGFIKAGGNTSMTTTAEKGKLCVSDSNDDSSMDSFPDIVDADPDSD